MSSTFKVPLTKIVEILPHPNADRLEIAKVYGFEVVVKKDAYKAGDKVIYIPIDSILQQRLEDHLFPPDAKIKLNKHRVRQIRIRKVASQGMLISPHDIEAVWGRLPETLEHDYQSIVGVRKYEPPARGSSQPNAPRAKKLENPYFRKYNGINNIKWFPHKFKADQEVVVQEKIHGSNVRFGIVPFSANTLWKKIKKLFGFAPKWEFCYGSNNVQLQDRRKFKGYYGEDIYGKLLQQCGAQAKVMGGEIVYGELYGDGVQKNYNYGCKSGEHKLVIFDVKTLDSDGTWRWRDPEWVQAYAKERGFDFVPVLYEGPFDEVLVKTFTLGPSVLAPSQKVREGVVIKSKLEYDKGGEKQCLKMISEKYLDKEQSDYH